MSAGRRVLLTGAAGKVGRILRAQWGDRYALRCADVQPLGDLAPHEEGVQLDIADLEAFAAACEGMDAVVHLAADPKVRAPFYDSLLQNNIIGGYNAFEAARRAGCRRVVFASSVNAVIGHRGQRTVDAECPVYPTSIYGASKCWGEALARVYSHEHGLSCICVRLSGPNFRQDGDWDPEELGKGDVARLVREELGHIADLEEELRAIRAEQAT